MHQVNFDRLVVRWEKGDHTLGEKEANRGNVLERLEEQHKHTIFDNDGAVVAVDDSDSEEEDGDRFPGKGRRLIDEFDEWMLLPGEFAGDRLGSDNELQFVVRLLAALAGRRADI